MSRTPSRLASISSELAANSPPSAWRSRSARPASPGPQAGQSNGAPMSVRSEKRTSGLPSASRRTTSATACASARSDLRNLSRAGRRDEEVARLDPRPDGAGAGGDRALRPVLDEKPQAGRRAGRPGADLEPRDRGDRGQRLAAEAEGHDGGQVAVGDFRGGVALDREREVGFVHAAPVVRHPDEAAPARLDRDLDRARPGVERVLDQLLHRRSRPLDHLARGDAIDKQGIETANWHGRAGPRMVIASARRRGKRALAAVGPGRRPGRGALIGRSSERPSCDGLRSAPYRRPAERASPAASQALSLQRENGA